MALRHEIEIALHLLGDRAEFSRSDPFEVRLEIAQGFVETPLQVAIERQEPLFSEGALPVAGRPFGGEARRVFAQSPVFDTALRDAFGGEFIPIDEIVEAGLERIRREEVGLAGQETDDRRLRGARAQAANLSDGRPERGEIEPEERTGVGVGQSGEKCRDRIVVGRGRGSRRDRAGERAIVGGTGRRQSMRLRACHSNRVPPSSARDPGWTSDRSDAPRDSSGRTRSTNSARSRHRRLPRSPDPGTSALVGRS